MAEIKFGEGAFHIGTVASAATTSVVSIPEHFITISGTATITSLVMSNYDWKACIATGALSITHNGTTLSCPNATSMTLAAGDTFTARADATGNVTISNWVRYSGKPVVNPTLTELGAGTIATQAASAVAITGGAINNTPIGATTATTVKGTTITATTEYDVGANKVVGARDTGWTAMTGTPDKASTFDVSTVTLAQLAARVEALQAALTTHGLLGA